MASVGIDIGSHYAKGVLFNDGKILSQAKFRINTDPVTAADKLLNTLTKNADVRIDHKAVTGVGGQAVSKALNFFPELVCHAKGVHFFCPSARTVIAIGAENYTVGKLDEKGNLVDFGTNDKCAAGTGIFIEEMAHALRIDISEMGELSTKATQDINMSSTCTVFAESEVVSMNYKKIPKEDIAKAIFKSIVTRLISLAKRVEIEKDVAVVGGVAKNVGIIRLLEESLDLPITVPTDPDITAALGAAILAQA
jgi:(R)-2-hydroxyacyl-CoA dehydratese activating ATPase